MEKCNHCYGLLEGESSRQSERKSDREKGRQKEREKEGQKEDRREKNNNEGSTRLHQRANNVHIGSVHMVRTLNIDHAYYRNCLNLQSKLRLTAILFNDMKMKM